MQSRQTMMTARQGLLAHRWLIWAGTAGHFVWASGQKRSSPEACCVRGAGSEALAASPAAEVPVSPAAVALLNTHAMGMLTLTMLRSLGHQLYERALGEAQAPLACLTWQGVA